LSITYRRQGRILEAIEPMRNDPSAQELIFLVRAFREQTARVDDAIRLINHELMPMLKPAITRPA
jgi:hypothetical protein